ncbi:hypothetical protein F2P81_022316 [Scophthalmus maximus]|uniref:Uncharacterized protein n=1 Tax=Scophthalmus maximus TaxID=52904 RepID=A0A6A4RZJ8_SCOMX|nr:hypothetical protein F2P81_022316 [Scophthalmus maximus]
MVEPKRRLDGAQYFRGAPEGTGEDRAVPRHNTSCVNCLRPPLARRGLSRDEDRGAGPTDLYLCAGLPVEDVDRTGFGRGTLCQRFPRNGRLSKRRCRRTSVWGEFVCEVAKRHNNNNNNNDDDDDNNMCFCIRRLLTRNDNLNSNRLSRSIWLKWTMNSFTLSVHARFDNRIVSGNPGSLGTWKTWSFWICKTFVEGTGSQQTTCEWITMPQIHVRPDQS